jgi:serine protease Do
MKLFDKLVVLFSFSAVIYSFAVVYIKSGRVLSDVTETVLLSAEENSNLELRNIDTFSLRPKISIPKEFPQAGVTYYGTGFKVGENLWMTARHVVDGCRAVYLNENTNTSDGSLRLIKKTIIHPRSDLAAFNFENNSEPLLVPTMSDKISKKSLLRMQAFAVGYPATVPGHLNVKYLGKAAIKNINLNTFEPVFVWTVSLKSPKRLGSVGGISGGPLLNAQKKLVGVMIAEQGKRGTVATADLHSINWILGTLEGRANFSGKPDMKEISTENVSEISAGLRTSGSVVQLLCKK